MNARTKESIFWFFATLIALSVITFGWQGLELLFYGEIQHRVVDDIIGVILFLSVFVNIAFIKSICTSKKDKEKYDNLHMKNYQVYYNALTTIEWNCKITDMIISKTIKNENGEETNIEKFDSIKSFANYIKGFNDINMEYIKKKLE